MKDPILPIGDSIKDTALLSGRFSTKTVAGDAILIDSTYTYGELWELRTRVTSWTGVGDSFKAFYYRAEAGVASGGKGLRTAEFYAMANATFSIDNLQAAYFEAGMKASGTQTIKNANAAEFALAPYGGTGAITITNYWDCILLTPSGVSSRIDATNAAKINGIHLLARDGDGGSTKLGSGIIMENDSGQSGTRTLTNGIYVNIGTTNVLNVSTVGTATDGWLIKAGTTGAHLTSTTAGGAIQIWNDVSATSGTQRTVWVETKLTGTGISTSCNTVRGYAELSGTATGASYIGGLQGKLKLSGTQNHEDSRLYATFVQLDVDGGTCTAGQLSGLWIDASGTPASMAGAQYSLLRVTNSTVASGVNQIIFAYSKADYFMVASAPEGTAAWMSTRDTPNQTATCDGAMKVNVQGKDLYLPLYNAVTIA